MRRLYLHIYLAFVAIGVASLMISGLITISLGEGPDIPAVDAATSIATNRDLSASEMQAQLAALADDTGVSITVWQRGGAVEVRVGEDLPRGRGAWFRRGPHRGVRVPLGEGRMLAVGFANSSWDRLRPFVFLVALAALVALGCYPLARRITRRLELVEEGVARWGGGDLSARVPVLGHDEIAGVARSFNDAATRVEHLFEAQRRVLASASHEIRSPLARLRMAIELAEEGLASEDWAAQAVRDVEELDTTVEDLLVVGRMQATPGPAHPEPVALRALVEEEAPHVGASVVGTGSGSTVQGDPRLLRRMVRNLMENARNHGAPPIEVEVHPDGVSVRDRGPGVPEALRERIFEPFYRPAGHDEGRDGGVGLGLHLVREIALHHGGTVTVTERPGGGAEFRVTLPHPE